MKRLFILAIVSMLVTFSYSQVYQFKSDSIAIVKFDSSSRPSNPSLKVSNHVISIDCSTGYLTISGKEVNIKMKVAAPIPEEMSDDGSKTKSVFLSTGGNEGAVMSVSVSPKSSDQLALFIDLSSQLKSGVIIAKAFKPSKNDLKSYNEFYNNFYKGFKLY